MLEMFLTTAISRPLIITQSRATVYVWLEARQSSVRGGLWPGEDGSVLEFSNLLTTSLQTERGGCHHSAQVSPGILPGAVAGCIPLCDGNHHHHHHHNAFSLLSSGRYRDLSVQSLGHRPLLRSLSHQRVQSQGAEVSQ